MTPFLISLALSLHPQIRLVARTELNGYSQEKDKKEPVLLAVRVRACSSFVEIVLRAVRSDVRLDAGVLTPRFTSTGPQRVRLQTVRCEDPFSCFLCAFARVRPSYDSIGLCLISVPRRRQR